MFAEAGYEVTCLSCEASRESPFYPLDPRVTRLNLWGRVARRAPWYSAIDMIAKGYAATKLLAPADWASKNLYFLRRLVTVFQAGRPDVVISFMPPANTVSLLAGKLAGVPVIPTNHNVPEQDFTSRERWDQNPLDRALRLWSLHSAARVHVLTPAFASWFPERLRSKIVALTNYVPPEFEKVRVDAPREQEILAVGRLAPVKNYGVLIKAWALLAARYPDWRVNIYGVGPAQADYERQIQSLGLQRSVRLMGHRSAMLPVYTSAEIFCHPALFEGFGLVAAEALACGLPVVAFADCSGVNDFVRHELNGLMVSREAGEQGLAEALERLITNRELRLRLRAAAPGSISELSFENFRRRWIDLVEEVRAEGQGAPTAQQHEGAEALAL